jgi:hypothetical protein
MEGHEDAHAVWGTHPCSNLLNAGVSEKGATVATALVSLRAEDLRPAPWIIRLLRAIGV